MGIVFSDFRRQRSPRVIALVALGLLAARVALGQWGWRDAACVLTLLLIYPFGEWAIHVYLLHAPPLRIAGRRFELPTSRAHRSHHESPNDLGRVLLGGAEVALLLGAALPAVVGLGGLLSGAPLCALLSALLAGSLAVGAYEWCHYLIHTAYRPRSRYFCSIWRSHRLHHFKNERYWHGVTSNISDRLLHTFPDQRTVERSPTARTLSS